MFKKAPGIIRYLDLRRGASINHLCISRLYLLPNGFVLASQAPIGAVSQRSECAYFSEPFDRV